MSDEKTREQEQEDQRALVKKQAEKLKKNQLATVQADPDLTRMYADSARVGSENLGGEAPLLKVHATGRSNTNRLADGSEPTDGSFFYKPTQEEFDGVEGIECHILTISKGFRAKGLEEDKEVFNQLLSGVIMHDGEFKPFVMYFTGKKLSNLWAFGKDARKYTYRKPVPIPMFALTVKLTTKKEKTDYGYAWIVEFEIQHQEDGSPIVVGDAGEFQFLRDSVSEAQELISSIIAAKTKNGGSEEDPGPVDPEY